MHFPQAAARDVQAARPLGGTRCPSEGKLAQLTTAPVSAPAVADIFASLLSEILTKCFLFPHKKRQTTANTDEKGHKRAETEEHAQAKGKGTCPPSIFVGVCIEIMPSVPVKISTKLRTK